MVAKGDTWDETQQGHYSEGWAGVGAACCPSVMSPIRAWHQMFWKEGEICFVLPSYKLFCEYLQGVLGVRGVGVLCRDGECWCCSPKVGLSVPGATKGWQPKRTLRAKRWYNGEGRGQTVLQNNPCRSRWRGHQTPSLQCLTLIRFEVSSEPGRAVQLFGEGDFVGCCDFPKWAKLHAFSSQGT